MADSTIISARPAAVDLELYRGDDFGPQEFQWTQSAVAINITGYTITAQVRAAPDDATALEDFTCTITDAANGKWTIQLTDLQTADLPKKAWWDMQLKSPGGVTRTFAKGKVLTDKDVTRPN